MNVLFTIEPRPFPGGRMTLEEACAWHEAESQRMMDEALRRLSEHVKSMADIEAAFICGAVRHITCFCGGLFEPARHARRTVLAGVRDYFKNVLKQLEEQ